MAAEPEAEQENVQTTRRGPGAMVWLLMLAVSGGLGFAVPFVLPDAPPADAADEQEAPPFEMLTAEQSVVVPFGEVTVNLDEGRMNRYLRLKIAVLVAKEDELMVTDAVTAQSAVLKNWLLSHLSDKTLEEIRGKAGVSMLRREIRRQFNETLFSDRRDHIYDILFEEFNVQ